VIEEEQNRSAVPDDGRVERGDGVIIGCDGYLHRDVGMASLSRDEATVTA
jgi:hypothetical protein